MNTAPLKSRAFVKVVSAGVKPVPFDFPWINNVSVSIQGDMADLANLQSEFEQIKQLVNADISKFKMNLKDFKIEISWLDTETPKQAEPDSTEMKQVNVSRFLAEALMAQLGTFTQDNSVDPELIEGVVEAELIDFDALLKELRDDYDLAKEADEDLAKFKQAISGQKEVFAFWEA